MSRRPGRCEERLRHPAELLLLRPRHRYAAPEQPGRQDVDRPLEPSEVRRKYPVSDSFAFQIISSLQEAKALIEKTQSLDPDSWKATIEAGDFSFDSPYHSGPTYVNPINHMADSCAEVGKIVFDDRPGSAVPGNLRPATLVSPACTIVLPERRGSEADHQPGRDDGGRDDSTTTRIKNRSAAWAVPNRQKQRTETRRSTARDDDADRLQRSASTCVQIIAGLGAGSVLFLVASGLTLVFGALRVINFAHGSLYLIGAYVTYDARRTSSASRTAIFWVVDAARVTRRRRRRRSGWRSFFFRPIYRRPLLTQLLVTFAFVARHRRADPQRDTAAETARRRSGSPPS